MTESENVQCIVLLIAGAKGAVGSTIAAAVEMVKKKPELVAPFLTTLPVFSQFISPQKFIFTGWDISLDSLEDAIRYHGVLPKDVWRSISKGLQEINVIPVSFEGLTFRAIVEKIEGDINNIRTQYPDALPVMINLLPACETCDLSSYRNLTELYEFIDPMRFPDMVFVLAALSQGIPVVNFTPNNIEVPLILEEAVKNGVAMSGRDGKTGQTYFKTAIASALKARHLLVEGWYSLNILGNQDGQNLATPSKAKGKISNKTKLLDEILGYQVGKSFGESTHKVRIDYYPPRGDNKESWDAIDISGLFGMPMSIRVNMLARDSILAAPLVIDLAIWMVLVQKSGMSGFVSDLSFYYKKTVDESPPIAFQEQLERLEQLVKKTKNELGQNS